MPIHGNSGGGGGHSAMGYCTLRNGTKQQSNISMVSFYYNCALYKYHSYVHMCIVVFIGIEKYKRKKNS